MLQSFHILPELNDVHHLEDVHRVRNNKECLAFSMSVPAFHHHQMSSVTVFIMLNPMRTRPVCPHPLNALHLEIFWSS